jgi:hypothetical protein
VPIEFGDRAFLPGDDIVIDEVRGDRSQFEVGGTYEIRGHYTLASRPRAVLAIYITNGDGPGPYPTTVVTSGRGNFDLRFTFFRPGWPHLSFYPENGDGFGHLYFGRGGTVYRGGLETHDAIGTP